MRIALALIALLSTLSPSLAGNCDSYRQAEGIIASTPERMPMIRALVDSGMDATAAWNGVHHYADMEEGRRFALAQIRARVAAACVVEKK
jgi:hypothetical protein